MKKIYLDTSVISFLEAYDAPDKMEITRKWWNEYLLKGKYKPYISSLVLDEINRCPEPKKQRLLKYIMESDFIEELKISVPVIELAKTYIENQIISPKYLNDALHIAVATVNNIGIITSWNFRHMVKQKTIKEVNKINKSENYPDIVIITPQDFFNYYK
ncbi:MAG: type II toxin-antitoxin system VapC family toxin [Caldanaerobacter subterraneus]|nr:type II toxin-antitoxin system VapC family toxin [Caldanaerobacter subterraneus]